MVEEPGDDGGVDPAVAIVVEIDTGLVRGDPARPVEGEDRVREVGPAMTAGSGATSRSLTGEEKSTKQGSTPRVSLGGGVSLWQTGFPDRGTSGVREACEDGLHGTENMVRPFQTPVGF